MIRFFAVLVASLFVVEANGQNYSRSTELPALRVSYADLQGLLSKASSLMKAANASQQSEIWIERVELQDGELKVTLPGNRLIESGARLPKSLDEFRYSVETRNAAPVTSVQMQFYGFRRTLTVEGKTPEQVDAVFSALREDLVRLSSVLGGAGVTIVAKMVLPILFGAIALVLFLNWVQQRIREYAIPALVAATCAAILLALPVEKLLGGFLAVEGDPSFLVRFGAEISFLGLVVGILALPGSYLLSRPKLTHASAPDSPGAPARDSRKKRRGSDRAR